MEGSKWTVTCSFCELYLDRARDLLGQEKDDRTNRAYAPERQIRLGKQGFFIEHLKQVPCKTVEEAMALIKTGSKLRMVAEMNMNKRSSRGHAIFTVQVIRTVERAHFTGQLHLVDCSNTVLLFWFIFSLLCVCVFLLLTVFFQLTQMFQGGRQKAAAVLCSVLRYVCVGWR